jgi:hypothetical protein
MLSHLKVICPINTKLHKRKPDGALFHSATVSGFDWGLYYETGLSRDIRNDFGTMLMSHLDVFLIPEVN